VKKSNSKTVTTGTKAEPGPKTTTGTIKTWVGPSVTDSIDFGALDDGVVTNTVTAGGNTQWSKYVKEGKTSLTSWLC